MTMQSEVVFVRLGLNSYEINYIVIEMEKKGWRLREEYNSTENGKLKLTFEKPEKVEKTKKSKKLKKPKKLT